MNCGDEDICHESSASDSGCSTEDLSDVSHDSVPYTENTLLLNHTPIRSNISPRHGCDTEVLFSDSSNQIPSTPTREPWSAYTARRALVKYRSRKLAHRHTNNISLSGSTRYNEISTKDVSTQSLVPSELIRGVLNYHYDTSRRLDVSVIKRLFAVFYCWYYGGIVSFYYMLTADGYRRSLLCWCLSCIAVTMVVIFLLLVFAVTTELVHLILLTLLESAGRFVIAILTTLTIISCMIAMLNFTAFDTTKIKHNNLSLLRI